MEKGTLTLLQATCTGLYKKVQIAYTRWRIWDAGSATLVSSESVRLKWFEADQRARYKDTRVWQNGRLMPWAVAVGRPPQ